MAALEDRSMIVHSIGNEERRFIVDTLRNVIFDLREDDEDKWFSAIDELKQVLDIFGEDVEDETYTY
jgi:hypothetical protein